MLSNIERALWIATGEWDNVRFSLSRCGDIGQFIVKRCQIIESDYRAISEGLMLVRNLNEMEKRFPDSGCSTMEAAYVFTKLASKAGKRLGFPSDLAESFGRGYTWIRTGRFDLDDGKETGSAVRRIFLDEFLVPIGVDFEWNFNSTQAKDRFKIVVDRVRAWNRNLRFRSNRQIHFEDASCPAKLMLN